MGINRSCWITLTNSSGNGIEIQGLQPIRVSGKLNNYLKRDFDPASTKKTATYLMI
jgi:beta-galactosidase